MTASIRCTRTEPPDPGLAVPGIHPFNSIRTLTRYLHFTGEETEAQRWSRWAKAAQLMSDGKKIWSQVHTAPVSMPMAGTSPALPQ